jgi:hypothetical protein
MIGLFWLHTFAINQLGLSVQDEHLRGCYLFNTLIALVFLFLLLFVSKHDPTILGWVFLLSSGLKFLLFFALIYPSFQATGLSLKQDFLTFFIPYAAALTLEIYQLIKILNREN